MADNNSSFVLGLMVGGVLGTIVGIMIAPKPGSETRAELIERSDAWRLRAEEMAAMVRDQMGPAVDEVRERVTPAVEAMRERVSPVVDQVSSRVGRSGDSSTDEATQQA